MDAIWRRRCRFSFNADSSRQRMSEFLKLHFPVGINFTLGRHAFKHRFQHCSGDSLATPVSHASFSGSVGLHCLRPRCRLFVG